MKVLVVGGAGYVGGAVTDMLLGEGYSVHVVDSLLYEDAYRKPVSFDRLDACDAQALSYCFKWADSIIWLAGIVGDGACRVAPGRARAINVDAVRNLPGLAGDKRIVFPSSCSIYGAQEAILKEDASLDPLSDYARQKVEAEALLSASNAVVFRLGTLYGAADRFSRPRFDLVVNALTAGAAVDGVIPVFGGMQFRPLLHVRDAADAIVRGLVADAGTYNLHRQNARIIDIAHQVRANFPNADLEVLPTSSEDERDYRVSSWKARLALDWTPKLTIDGGIAEMRELIRQGRVRDPFLPRYHNAKHLKDLKWESISPRPMLARTSGRCCSTHSTAAGSLRVGPT